MLALTYGVLESITRDRLIKVMDVAEGSLQVDDLRGASEAFLASTTREVQAVAAIDGNPLAAAPGPRTEEAQRAFAETLGEEVRELRWRRCSRSPPTSSTSAWSGSTAPRPATRSLPR